MTKLGRNELCHCGSGKKYKKCHMLQDQAVEKEKRAAKDAATFVARDLMKFARDDRFASGFAKALPHYWNGLYDIDNAEEMSQYEALRFFDWFVYDYMQEEEPIVGRRLIHVYHTEKREDLASVQQKILDSWLEAGPASAYELVEYDGQHLQLRDFMTGDMYTAYEPGGRGQVEIGEIILGRLVTIIDHLEFSTTAAYLPTNEIADLKDKLVAAQVADAEQYPNATHQEFMRRHNYLLIHHALEQAKIQERPPVARLDPDRPDKMTQTIARRMKRRAR